MIELSVNGKTCAVDVDEDTPLLWVLRDRLGLTGTKYACGAGLCGSCTVHVEGRAVRACMVPVGSVAGQAVRTIEGLAEGGRLHVVQQAWLDQNVAQCGYCQPGQIMSAVALLRQTPAPTDEDIDRAMQGNLCRCGTYPRIRRAIRQAAELLAQREVKP